MINDKHKLLAIKNDTRKEVDLSQWAGKGAKVRVKFMSIAERLALMPRIKDKEDGYMMAEYIAATVVNDKDELMFKSPEDINDILNMDVNLVRTIFEAAFDLNLVGLTKDDIEKKPVS